MTEMSPVTHLVPPFATAKKPGSIDLRFPGTECRLIVRIPGKDSEPGERGELWMRGPQVMQGYLNNPKATGENGRPRRLAAQAATSADRDEDGWFEISDRLKG